MLAFTSDDLVGVTLCLDGWHCQANMTSDDFTGPAVLHYTKQELMRNKGLELNLNFETNLPGTYPSIRPYQGFFHGPLTYAPWG